jgi:hypothetical protein
MLFPWHVVPLKIYICVFPILFTHCGRVWFTHAMPRPCHSTSMPFRKRFLKATAQRGMGMACVNYHRPSTDGMWATYPHWAPSSCHAEFHEGCYQKHTNPLNCRTSSSDISGYHADFREGHGTVGEWHVWINATRHGRGTAWARHCMCELALTVPWHMPAIPILTLYTPSEIPFAICWHC